MKQPGVENFLNLPGVVGLVVMDGRSRPYFYGIDHALNFQQKEALSQGIQQVVNTTPPGFESFSFQFAQRKAHIYKLLSGLILLVLTEPPLDALQYQDALQQLKLILQDDPHSAIATFRMVAESSSLREKASRQTQEPNAPTAEAAITPPYDPAAKASLPAPAVTPGLAAAERVSAESTVWHWHEVLAALDSLSDVTTHYLGKIVVTNNWRSTRPDADWLQALQIDHEGHFTLSPESLLSPQDALENQTHDCVQQWVKAFVQRCGRIIRNYQDTILKEALDEHQRAALKMQDGA